LLPFPLHALGLGIREEAYNLFDRIKAIDELDCAVRESGLKYPVQKYSKILDI
jgi:hypothetical protein